ncbi:MAG TPA: hypothetical protein PLP33_16500 [Leptospiraceae bacterium]|nr:hypothetical protein [Leptospiraceae bacterium]
MLDKTKLASLKHKLKLMRQENGETTGEYLKRYSQLEKEIKQEETRLSFIEDTQERQQEIISIEKRQKINDMLLILTGVLFLAIFLSIICYFCF